MQIKKILALTFANLLKIKSLITLAIIGVTCYLAITKILPVEAFTGFAGAIITYYFTKPDKDSSDKPPEE